MPTGAHVTVFKRKTVKQSSGRPLMRRMKSWCFLRKPGRACRPCPPARPRALGEAIAWGLSTPLQPPSCPTSCLPFHPVPGSGKHFVGVKRVNLSICLHHPRHTVSENRIPVSQIILFLPATFSDHRTLNVPQVPVTAPLICVFLKVHYCYCRCHYYFPHTCYSILQCPEGFMVFFDLHLPRLEVKEYGVCVCACMRLCGECL